MNKGRLILITCILFSLELQAARYTNVWNFAGYQRVYHVYTMTAHGTQDSTTYRMDFRAEGWHGSYGVCPLVNDYWGVLTHLSKAVQNPSNGGVFVVHRPPGATGTWGVTDKVMTQNVGAIEGCYCYCTTMSPGSHWREPIGIVGYDVLSCRLYSWGGIGPL